MKFRSCQRLSCFFPEPVKTRINFSTKISLRMNIHVECLRSPHKSTGGNFSPATIIRWSKVPKSGEAPGRFYHRFPITVPIINGRKIDFITRAITPVANGCWIGTQEFEVRDESAGCLYGRTYEMQLGCSIEKFEGCSDDLSLEGSHLSLQRAPFFSLCDDFLSPLECFDIHRLSITW